MSKRKHSRRKRGGDRYRSVPRCAAIPPLPEVCVSPDNFLGRLDIAALNLMCASGLPGAEKPTSLGCWTGLIPPPAMSILRPAAIGIGSSTRPAHTTILPAISVAIFSCSRCKRIWVSNTIRPVAIPTFQDPKSLDPDFRDSRDLFLHGIIDGDGGTVRSMPVLYVAVGRRLATRSNWSSRVATCSFAGTTRRESGFRSRNALISREPARNQFFPGRVLSQLARTVDGSRKGSGLLLKSLTPAEELAGFLSQRRVLERQWPVGRGDPSVPVGLRHRARRQALPLAA